MVGRRQAKPSRKPRSKKVIVRVKLGRVLRIVRTGHVLVSPSRELEVKQELIGAKVLRGSSEVGVVMDVIGLIEKPYIVVKPLAQAGSELSTGEELQALIERIIPLPRGKRRPSQRARRRRAHS